MRRLEDAIAQRVLLSDGGIRRQLRRLPFDAQRDLWGFKDRLELLCLTRPNWVRSFHEAYLRAGADIICIPSLAACPLSCSTAEAAKEFFYLNYIAAQLACEAVDNVPGRGRRRFVLGLIRDNGRPTAAREMKKTITSQVEALISGGVDGVALNVSPNSGRASIFLSAACEARRRLKARVPIYFQSSPGMPSYSSSLVEQTDGVIVFRFGRYPPNDWLSQAVELEGVTMIGGGETPEVTAEIDRHLRLLADDGLRPLHATARASGMQLEESCIPSSALHLDPLASELH